MVATEKITVYTVIRVNYEPTRYTGPQVGGVVGQDYVQYNTVYCMSTTLYIDITLHGLQCMAMQWE